MTVTHEMIEGSGACKTGEEIVSLTTVLVT